MRKLIVGAVMGVALLGAPAVAEAAPPPPPGWTHVTDPIGCGSSTCTLPAGQFCKFAVDISIVANEEIQNVTTRADGTTVTKIKGLLVLSFKNDNPKGRKIVKNVSGSTTTTVSPDGSHVTQQGDGANWWTFGPIGRMNTGEPALVFTYGPVTVAGIAAKGVLTAQTFSLHGIQENGCALLS